MTAPRATGRRTAKYYVQALVCRSWTEYQDFTNKRRAIRCGRWQSLHWPSVSQRWRVVRGKSVVIAKWVNGKRVKVNGQRRQGAQ